jgi:hypothetical protein
MTKIAGSGSISQRHGTADPNPDPDPHQNVMDPEHCLKCLGKLAAHMLTRRLYGSAKRMSTRTAMSPNRYRHLDLLSFYQRFMPAT